MMMMADGLLGPCSDQVIEGVTVKVESDPETEDDGTQQAPLSNGYPTTMSMSTDSHCGSSLNYHHMTPHQEVVETVTHLFSSLSAACANCSISFFDPIGNPVYQPIFYMSLDQNPTEAIQISSVIHIIFAKKLSRCPKPSYDLALCTKCADLIARMYQIYRELDGLSAVNAYINSFLGDTNTNEVYLPTPPESVNPPQSSATTINYAHYEDAISAAISGGSSSAASVDMSNYGIRSSNSATTQVGHKPMTSTEPPPLTYPSTYYGPPRTNPFTLQQYPNDKFMLPDTYPPPGGQPMKVEQISNPPYGNLGTDFAQQVPPSQPPEKSAKKRKRKSGSTPQVPPLPPPPVTPAPGRPRSERVIHCPEAGCDKVYHGRGATASLRTHIQIFHLKQFPFVCQICLKPLKKRSLLEIHVKSHLGVEEKTAAAGAEAPLPTPLPLPEPIPSIHTCPDCGKVYDTPYLLSVHVAAHHPPPPPTEAEAQSFPCGFPGCSKKFWDRASLRRHENRHETPQFACSRCPQHFPNKKLLKAHQETCALDQRQFLCRADNCKRKFKYKHHLQNHYMFQHKLSAEEARKEVYPGLSVKEWMTPTRKRSPAAAGRGRPPDEHRGGGGGGGGSSTTTTTTDSDQLPPFNTVLGLPPTTANEQQQQQAPSFTPGGGGDSNRLLPEPFGTGMIYESLPPQIGSTNQNPNLGYSSLQPPFHTSPADIRGGHEMSPGGGYSYHPHHHRPLEGQGHQGQNPAVSFGDLIPSGVIQETSPLLHLHNPHHHHHPLNSFPNSSVVHTNPSVIIQQNPITLYHHHQNNHSSPPPPLSSSECLQNHGNSSGGTSMTVNEVQMDLRGLNE